MARGRFISRAVITDRAIHSLSSDTCRLAFTWLITLADCEGRTVGEPDLLKAALFPRRSDITPEQIESYTAEWANAGFILWYYGSDGDRYIQFLNFEKHQLGLRKDREAASEIEAPDNCRTVDGLTPEEIGLRLRLSLREGEGEVKGEENDTPDLFSETQRMIESVVCVPPNGEAGIEAIREIMQMGATMEDIQGGFDWLRGQGGKRPVTFYSSLVGPVRTAMAQRLQSLQKRNGKQSEDPMKGYTPV